MAESILENLANIYALSKKQEENLIDMLLRLKYLEDEGRKSFTKEAIIFVEEIIAVWYSVVLSFTLYMRSNVSFFLPIFLIFFLIGTATFRASYYESGLAYTSFIKLVD